VYEPAQSKNVRAIVVAWLSDLKRTGALQGSAILRKTLFDDCQGERYEELMLAVSNMVLKTVMERGTTKQSMGKHSGYCHFSRKALILGSSV